MNNVRKLAKTDGADVVAQLVGLPCGGETAASITQDTTHLNPIQDVSNAKNLKHEATSQRKRDLLGQQALKRSASVFGSSNLCVFI